MCKNYYICSVKISENLNMLRYFYEKYPQYCVIAAGSLLESLFDNKISFPVGRVEYKVVRPLSFREFLRALDEKQALAYYDEILVKEIAHEKLKKTFSHIHAYRRNAGSRLSVFTTTRHCCADFRI